MAAEKRPANIAAASFYSAFTSWRGNGHSRRQFFRFGEYLQSTAWTCGSAALPASEMLPPLLSRSRVFQPLE